MINVVGLKHRAREFLQQVVLFVGSVVRADHTDRRAALRFEYLLESSGRGAQRVFPCGRFQLACFVANERLRKTVGALHEIESEAALGAEKVTVDAAFVAVVGANDLRSVVGLAYAERDLAAVRAMGADGGDVVHLPGARLVAIAAAGERAHRAHVNAHAALLAIELARLAVGSDAIGSDHGACTAVLHAQCPHIHALAAHANAAVTENAARAIVVDGRRPLLLVAMMLGLGVEAFARAVLEGHVLQFALAAGIAHRAIERVVPQQ